MLIGYSDSEWASNGDDCKSTSGTCFSWIPHPSDGEAKSNHALLYLLPKRSTSPYQAVPKKAYGLEDFYRN